ncbi:MAG: FN3 associated domain-containing protein [Terracidiphilus sp.]
MLTRLDRFKGYSARETCVALLSMLAILLFASAIAVAQTPIVVSQQTWGANETNSAATYETTTVSTVGGAWGPASAGGHSAAVNSYGVFVTGTSYGDFIEQFTTQNSVMTVIGESDIAPGGIAIDRNNNLYISGESSNIVYKIPVNTTAHGAYGIGTYGPINSVCPTSTTCQFGTAVSTANGITVTPPPTCAGIGQSPDISGICQIDLGNGNYGFNVASLAVDIQHNLFFTTDGNAGSATPSAPYSVFECNTACLYPTGGATPAPVQIYVEPAGSGGQLYSGGIAVDQNDNVYFTDSFISSSGATSGYSTYSDLYQAPYNSTSKTYAAAPTLLATLTPACANPATGTPCSDAITTVATDLAGNVYFGSELDGVFEIANNGSALAGNPSVFPISGDGVKTIAPDGNGNFYFVSANPTTTDDTAGFLTVGSVVDTAQAWSGEPAGQGAVSNVSAVDPTDLCSSASNLTFAENMTSYGFSGAVTTGSTCTALPFASGASFPVTITFTPSASEAGPYNTTMTATDAADGDTGTFPVSGVAAIAQTITVISPSAASSRVAFGAAPVILEATASSGLPVVFTTTTPTVCTGLETATVTFIDNGVCTIDANQAGNSEYAPAPQKVITFTVTPQPQRLTITTPLSIPYTTTPIPLTAASSNMTSSAAPICFSYLSGPGTVSGVGATAGTCFPPQTLTITGAGAIVVTMSQAASPGYLAGSSNPAITVTSAPQNIVFTAPSGTLASAPASIVYGASLTLAATGGASGMPVTFTLDPLSTGYVPATPASGSTAAVPASSTAGSISSSGVLTATGLGTIVIDANQAASDATATPDYAAATQLQAFFTVAPVTATAAPVISPANGATLYSSGGLNMVTITDSVAGAAIYYTTDGSTPTLSSTAYTAPFAVTTAGPATINAIALAAGYGLSTVATANYTLSTTAANFTATVAPASVTVSPGSPGIVDITVASQYGFNSATTFACSTVPSNLTCSFNPATVTPAAGQSASTALTLTESGSTALLHRSSLFLPGGVTFAIAFCFLGWKKRRVLALTLVLIAGAIGVTQLTGCGGGKGSAKATTSSVVVTATGAGLTQTIKLQVTVNPS